jgi:hypothetical protein
LDYNSPDRLLEYLHLTQSAAIQSGKLIVYSYPAPGPFRMAHAKNMAHRLGILEGADILVNLDADNFTGQNFASYVAEKFTAATEDAPVFLWANRNQPSELRYPKGCNGRIVVSKHAFLNAGGYDEKYNTWGPDDKDFNCRLRRLGYIGGEIDRSYLNVVLHTDRMRFKEYPHAEGAGEDSIEIENETTTIANWGRFGMGVVFRNFGAEPIELGPLPTRIFGIGMHKTGTTSLHSALQILGYDAAHWKSAHWAKSIWREMNAPHPGLDEDGFQIPYSIYAKSPTLERSYALCDLPIPLLFRELDEGYRGSKFILTTRNEDRWLTSVKNHWDPDRNKFRAGWDSDPFTHKVHKLLYGQKGFNADLFRARFRRHNAEVLAHFKNRPDDLLVMDMDDGAGWPQLCGFLKRAIPSVPYPERFQTPFGKKGAGI